jgi:LacI family repressor for deo operon, udp, cdd, tsx, nupC, and nupG
MQRGYHTLLLQYGDEANLLAECRNLIDGLVLCCLEERPSLDVLRTFMDAGIPLVSLEPCSGLDIDVVTADREFGSYLAVKHLRNLGHTRIALAQVALKSEVVSRRTMGYQCAMQDLGLEPQVMTHPGGGQSAFEDGYGLIREALAQGLRPTAWVFSDDELAVGALRAFQERQIRVPNDVAIVGWDNSPLCDFVRPRLTSVTQPIPETVSRLVERLLARLEGVVTPAEVTLIRPELIVRESCGSPDAW